MADEVRFPDVVVKLVGEDANVFSIIGNVKRGLQRAGYEMEASEFSNDAMNCDSYDEVLRLAMQTVVVE